MTRDDELFLGVAEKISATTKQLGMLIYFLVLVGVAGYIFFSHKKQLGMIFCVVLVVVL